MFILKVFFKSQFLDSSAMHILFSQLDFLGGEEAGRKRVREEADVGR